MYAPYFGLKHEPFSIAPDPRYLFMSERHREALAHLLYGVDGGGGFVLLSGEIGAGKTTVCRCFLEQVPPATNVAYIFNPKLTVVELLQSICEEFGVVPRPRGAHGRTTIKDHLDPLNEFLLAQHAAGRNNVLIIDEAQMLSGSVLEQLRLLTNLETSAKKLLQIILIGQPELRELVARPELEQLAQRVIARYHLDALTLDETERYVRHRLSVAGMSAAMPFDTKAIRRIHQLSRGVPRRINLLCDRALLGAYAAGRPTVDRGIVERAAREVFDPESATRPRGPARDRRRQASLAALGGAILALGALLASFLWRGPAGVADAGAAGSAPSRAVGSASAPSGALLPSVRAEKTAAAATGSPLPSPGLASATSVAASGFAVSSAPPTPSLPARSDAAGPVPPTFLLAADLRARFKTAARDEREAWRELAPAWQLPLDAGDDPCAVAQRNSLQCFRSPNSTLALIRQLDRPGILTLRDDADRPVYALLTGLGAESATLRLGDVSQTVTLVSLATIWRGDYATFWRAPAGYAGRPVDAGSGPVASVVARQLSALNRLPIASGEADWKSQVAAFQLSQGLKPDGVAGPTTFMQLNRIAGVDEPRLRVGPAPS